MRAHNDILEDSDIFVVRFVLDNGGRAQFHFGGHPVLSHFVGSLDSFAIPINMVDDLVNSSGAERKVKKGLIEYE